MGTWESFAFAEIEFALLMFVSMLVVMLVQYVRGRKNKQ